LGSFLSETIAVYLLIKFHHGGLRLRKVNPIPAEILQRQNQTISNLKEV